MSSYRYLTTDILSGEILADNLPIVGQNFGRQVNVTGSFSGSLMLTTDVPQTVMSDWLAAVEPWKSVLWALQDEQPIWNGVITGWPHQSILDGTLPLSASTMETMFQYRQISTDLTYTDMDVFDIFRALAVYAVSKTPNGAIAGLVMGDNLSGITDSISFDGSQYQKVYDAWTGLVGEYGIEYSIRPALTEDDELVMYLDLGYPQLGRNLTQSPLTMIFPGYQMTDYQWMRVPSTGPANHVAATASTTTTTLTSQAPHGYVSPELAQGYPLLEDSASLTGVTAVSQALVNTFADGAAALESITAMTTPVLKLGAEGYPKVNQILLGDACQFAATSPLHPANPETRAPGLQIAGRISSWTLYPPGGGQVEATWYTLGDVVDVS